MIKSELMIGEPNPTLPDGFDYVYVVDGKDSDTPPCGDKCVQCLKCYRKRQEGQEAVIRQRLH
jgi:hypothetical protein